jgi:hypothetical protein
MFKKMLEKYIREELPEERFNLIAAIATADIRVNRIRFSKKTNLNEVIKIAAACAGTLARCG